MKTNKLSASEAFAKDIQGLMARHYREMLSEHRKRGTARKKEQEKLLLNKSK